MKLLINVDDFGVSRSVNDAVVELIKYASISSTTVMVNAPFASEAKFLTMQPAFELGLHINLTEGSPIQEPSKVPSLVAPTGEFYTYDQFRRKLFSNQIDTSHIISEFEAQLSAFIDITKQKPSHLDSHQNIHKLKPVQTALLSSHALVNMPLRCPRRYIAYPQAKKKIVRSDFWAMKNLRLRRYATDRYLSWIATGYAKKFKCPQGELHSSSARKLDLLNILRSGTLKEATVDYVLEVACHPISRPPPKSASEWMHRRYSELLCLKDLRFQSAVSKQLVSWGDLSNFG